MKTKLLSISFLSVLFANIIFAQTAPDYRKLHYLSEEEMNTPLTKSRSFYPTDPPEGVIRNVAEFDHMQGVLIRYPFGIPMELIREMAEDITVLTLVANASQQQTVTTQYQNNNVNLDNCDFLIAQTDSYWTRDYGPWFVFDGNGEPGIVNFPYNRPRPNDDDIPIKIAEYLDIDLYGMSLISTGGNYMCTGRGIAASTDLVWDENPTLTTDEVAAYVNDYLGNSLYDVLNDPLGEYIKHIDCWSKYLSPNKILIGQVDVTDWRYQDYEDLANYFATTPSSYGTPWEVYRVYTPGTYPYTPYTNSTILNNKVLVPLTGGPFDDEALEAYEEAMPGYEIVGIVYNGWENTDALHCRTKGIADIGMLYIDHLPLLGNIGFKPEYEITANITAHSGATIYTDSVLINYKINSGDYITTVMELDSGNTYTGTIGGVMPHDTVSYYIYAADNSGRQAKQPYIGEPDPFVFTNIYFPAAELVFNPDSVIFLSETQMIEGIPLNIINNLTYKSTITSLTEFGTVFPWNVEEMPVLPIDIEPNDTLKLNILCPFITNKGAMVIDTMFVETLLDTYTEIIAIDGDLLTSVNILLEEDIVVYPNPFNNLINIKINNYDNDDISIQIYDNVGNLLVNKNNMKNTAGIVSIDLAESFDIKPGTYYYKLMIGENIVAGKLIKVN